MTTAARVGVAALMVALGASPLPAEAGDVAGRRGHGDLGTTMTPLIGREGERLVRAFEVNERGEVLVQTDAAFGGPGVPDRRDVVWADGTVTPVGPEDRPVELFDISDRGHVTGIRCDVGPAGPCGTWTTFRWRDGVFTPLEIGGYTGAAPWAVNRRGEILGNDAAGRVVVWHADGRRSVAPIEPMVIPTDINDRGQALVQIYGLDRSGVWRAGGRVTVLDSLDGRRSAGVDINQAGHVAGTSSTAAAETHAVLWRDGELLDLGTLGGSWAETVAVNDRDQVIGESVTAADERHAFLWDDGRMIDLGTLGGASSRPTAINNRGQVVGASQTSDGSWHAFLWDDGRMIDLSPVDTGERRSAAHDINDRGQIVGQAFTGESGGAVMWTVTRHRR